MTIIWKYKVNPPTIISCDIEHIEEKKPFIRWCSRHFFSFTASIQTKSFFSCYESFTKPVHISVNLSCGGCVSHFCKLAFPDSKLSAEKSTFCFQNFWLPFQSLWPQMALREAYRYQNGWIFGKVPNGLWPPPPPHFRKIILQIFWNIPWKYPLCIIFMPKKPCSKVQNLQ